MIHFLYEGLVAIYKKFKLRSNRQLRFLDSCSRDTYVQIASHHVGVLRMFDAQETFEPVQSLLLYNVRRYILINKEVALTHSPDVYRQCKKTRNRGNGCLLKEGNKDRLR